MLRHSMEAAGLIAITLLLLAGDESIAQTRVITPASPPNAAAAKAAAEAQKKATQGNAGKKGDDKSKDGDKKKAEDKPTSIKRPEKPPAGANPDGLKVRPDKAGRIQFNLGGHPWPEVLQWYADIAHLSLDWQELPRDYINLVTQRSYDLPEARNLLNRHLLARGYTMILNGETLTVVKIDQLNPALVPRVDASALADLPDHDVAKVSFKLKWLVAEKTVEELKPMLSAIGKANIAKLSSTNRIEIIDTVANLRDVNDVLSEEQSEESEEQLVREFRLEHRRASEVIDLVRDLMGIRKEVKIDKVNAQHVQFMQQAVMQMIQRGMQNNQGKGNAKPEERMTLVLNQRDNSILAMAPPNKMAEIERAITTLDVQIESDESIPLKLERTRIYRLESFDPEALVELLNELGDLSPHTQLKVDDKKNAIIAYTPSLVDHATIQMLVDKLDGSYRKFEVIQLRRLEADYVAGTIRFLMGDDSDDDKNQNSRRRYYYYDYYGSNNEGNDAGGKFRVDADIVNNRLMLFASEVELQEIEQLLIKLGEIPSKSGNSSMMRLIDIDPRVDPEEFMRKLQQLWPHQNRIQVTPLQKPDIPDAEESPEPPPPAESEPDGPAPEGAEDDVQVSSTKPVGGELSLAARSVDDLLALAGTRGVSTRPPETERVTRSNDDNEADSILAQLAADNDQDEPRSSVLPTRPRPLGPPAPPINISVTPGGKLLMTSEDTDALNELEDLLNQLTPPRRDYQIFKLKYASPLGVALMLEDFYEQDKGERIMDWFGDYVDTRDTSPSRLSKRRTPKFISDSFTGTILVQGADPRQLRDIEELIMLYDQPEPTDSRSVRKTVMFRIQYSRASVIAEAVKEVYRDLLSENDKSLQDNKDGKQPIAERVYTYIDDNGDDGETPIKFKGLLSIGVDDYSNTLIVSATAGLLENITQMVEELDEAARPASGVRVLQVDRRLNSALLQERLKELFGPKPPPQQQNQQNPNQPNQQQPNGNGRGVKVSVN